MHSKNHYFSTFNIEMKINIIMLLKNPQLFFKIAYEKMDFPRFLTIFFFLLSKY